MRSPAGNLLLVCVLLFSAAVAHADGNQVGEFEVIVTLPELLGEESAGRFEGVVDADEAIEWQMYVPETYDPDTPAGLMVYISPSNSGAIPERWKEVMGSSNLIWIGANRSGNRVRVARRAAYAMVAPSVAVRDYRVDSSRVYLSGFSGGGRIASMIAPQFPQVFNGAIFICGGNFWDELEPAQLEAVQANRYVFLTGKQDFNRDEVRSAYRLYRTADVESVLLMDINGMDHHIPSAQKFAEAIAFLDDN